MARVFRVQDGVAHRMEVGEFIRMFRLSRGAPVPFGIVFTDWEGNAEGFIPVNHELVLCDLCNETIHDPELMHEDNLKNHVYIIGSYALCESCFQKVREDAQ